jgi:hypothetical protein
MLPNLPYGELLQAAQGGSPLLLNVAGRALGLGQAEQAALAQGNIPGWFWAVAGVSLGVVVGVQVYKRWPDKVPAFVQGE